MSHVLGKQCCNKKILVQSNSEVCHDSSLSGLGSHLKVSSTGRCAGKVDLERLKVNVVQWAAKTVGVGVRVRVRVRVREGTGSPISTCVLVGLLWRSRSEAVAFWVCCVPTAPV